jgi:hypothetical protein
MFTRIALIGLSFGLVIGCAKKVKPTGKNETPVAAATQPTGGKQTGENSDKNKKSDKPNWLTDPRAETTPNQLPAENQFGKPGLGVTLPKPDGNAKLPPAPKPPGGNTTGVLQPQSVTPPGSPSAPKAGKPVTEADMKEVWIFMDGASIVSGKLPPMPLVYAALVKAEAKAAELVKDGSIYITGTTTRESIWAFEAKALTNGGWVASQNGVEILTAAELKKRLGQR